MDRIDREETPAEPVARRPDEKKILRARPMKGPIDHAALIREHIGRYPKIIAALAEYERRCRQHREREQGDAVEP